MALYHDLPAGQAITDGVHGPILLTTLEKQLIDHPCFQRLRNVRQLGLASLVYPSADYSRFSHSLGAMDAMGKLVGALHTRYDEIITPTVVKVFRVAALLHDVGHYPLSHLYEQAICAYTGLNQDQILNHERAGACIISNRLAEILDKSQLNEDFNAHLLNLNVDTVTLSQFTAWVLGHEPRIGGFGVYGVLNKLLSGAIDCDRLDYLLRTSKGSSLPYGIVDLDYLITNVKLQNQNTVVFSQKAQSAALHMLEGRVYDYLTTSYHRTVKALETELIKAVVDAMQNRELPCSEEDLRKMVAGNGWATFDDSMLRATLLCSNSDDVRARAERTYDRVVKKTLFSRTFELSKKRFESLGNYKTFKSKLRERINEAPVEGVPAGEWFLETVEGLDAGDATMFAEMESEGFRKWWEEDSLRDGALNICSQVQHVRDRVVLIVHYYLDPNESIPPTYKTSYETLLENFVLQQLRITGDLMQKLA